MGRHHARRGLVRTDMARPRFRLRWRRRQLKRAGVVLAAVFVVAAIALFVNLYRSSSPHSSASGGGSGDNAAGLGGPGGLPSSSISVGPGDTSILSVFPTE